MAIINCKYCGKAISDKASICPHCNSELNEYQQNNCVCQECGSEISDNAKSCPNCGCPINTTVDSASSHPKKHFSIKKCIIVAVVAIAIIAVVAIIIYLAGKDGRLIKRVQDMTANGQYTEAITLLGDLEDQESYMQERDKIFDSIDNEIYTYIENGDYIAAQELLNEYTSILPDASTIQEIIKYESLSFECIYNLREALKNPNSLQIKGITFYENDSANPYPIVVIHESAQNGFGGYTVNYSVFSSLDLSHFGSCDSLDKSDYDTSDLDELTELVVCVVITSLDETQKIDVNVDINRINNILSSGITPKYDCTQYKDTSSESAEL